MSQPQAQADIPIAVLIDEDSLILYGALDLPIPTAGDVHLDGGPASGRFFGTSWAKQAEDGPGRWFLAGIRVPDLARLKPNRVEVKGDDGSRMVIPRLTNVRTSPTLLISALKGEQGPALGAALDLLFEMLAPIGAAASERGERLLLALAHEVARPDGYAEIFGRFHGPGLMVQGWAHTLRAGSRALLVEAGEGGHQGGLHRASVADFARSDLPPEAGGVVAVLPDAETDPAAIRRVYHRGPEGWGFLEVFQGRTILPVGVAVAHLRDKMAELKDAAEIRGLIATQYEGRETVSRIEGPVRFAVDGAFRVPGAGLFLSGWMLDPTRMVDSVTLKGPRLASRIDATWTRTNRKDVSEAFRADPAFAGRIEQGRDAHGFLAFVPEPAGIPAGSDFHLQLRLGEDACAFMPVAPALPTPDQIRRILSAIDVNDPAVEATIARHVGPMVQAASRISRALVATGAFPMGPDAPAPRLSVIIPVTDGREDIDLNLARLAVDPDLKGAEILVAAGAASHERLPFTLRRAAEFYRLPVRLVPAKGAHDDLDAAEAALPHARAEQVLLLSPSVLPTAPGWLSGLEAAATRVGKPALVSPTLLYEDHSIRFAGIVADPAAEDGYVGRYAGYPLSWLKEAEPAPVAAGSLDCALLPKRLVAAAGGLSAAFVGTEYKTLDFCLRLASAGFGCHWVPGVRLVALDENAHAAPEYWQQTAALVDRWGFRAAWSPRTLNAA